jgi:hypothetical protein
LAGPTIQLHIVYPDGRFYIPRVPLVERLVAYGEAQLLTCPFRRKIGNRTPVTSLLELYTIITINTRLRSTKEIRRSATTVGRVYTKKAVKEHDVPCHHRLDQCLHDYIEAAGITDDLDAIYCAPLAARRGGLQPIPYPSKTLAASSAGRTKSRSMR